jgi:hypothetical protein
VARSNQRLAAGVGIVSLFLLLGGSTAAVVSADPGGGHSDHGNSSNKHGNGHGRDDSKAGGPANDDSGGRAPTAKVKGGSDQSDGSADVNDDVAAPKVRFGSGRDNQQSSSPGDAAASDGVIAGVEPALTGGASGATGSADVSASVSPGATAAGIPSPRVTFGNGRTPGIDVDDPEPDWQGPVTQWQPDTAPPPPPAPPAPAPPPSWVHRIATQPAPTKQFGVAPAADLTDPLWGVAGLLLIPAAGAVLGYRQARAAQAVERMHGS